MKTKDKQTLRRRIEEVCAIQGGWMNGDGEKIWSDPDQVEMVAVTLSNKLGVSPGVFPDNNGYVSLQWFLGDDNLLEVLV
jgi:hypothetical protein